MFLHVGCCPSQDPVVFSKAWCKRHPLVGQRTWRPLEQAYELHTWKFKLPQTCILLRATVSDFIEVKCLWKWSLQKNIKINKHQCSCTDMNVMILIMYIHDARDKIRKFPSFRKVDSMKSGRNTQKIKKTKAGGHVTWEEAKRELQLGVCHGCLSMIEFFFFFI